MTSSILFLGDTHGDLYCLEKACRTAKRHGAWIFQVGDFGYLWPGADVSERAEEIVREEGVRLVFIDGNHDPHHLLPDRFMAPDGLSGRPVPEHEPGIYYIRRGGSAHDSDTVVVGMGGAPSIDRGFRKEGKSWWPTEEITEADVEAALRTCGEIPDDEGRVIVLACHDAPHVPSAVPALADGPWKKTIPWFEPLAEASKEKVRRVMNHLYPDLFVHGHYHEREESKYIIPKMDADIEIPVYSLAHNYCPGGVKGILTTMEKGTHEAPGYHWRWLT